MLVAAITRFVVMTSWQRDALAVYQCNVQFDWFTSEQWPMKNANTSQLGERALSCEHNNQCKRLHFGGFL